MNSGRINAWMVLALRKELHCDTNSEEEEIMIELKNSIMEVENSEKSLASRIDKESIGENIMTEQINI